MALTQRLELRQSHALVMTPQLMQAIKLLQLSNLDLVGYVESELERNPLLERTGDGEGEPAPKSTAPTKAKPSRRRRAPMWRPVTPTGAEPAAAASKRASIIWKPSCR